jgi:hypothetical protein
MFSGMISPLDPDSVLSGLGDKFLAALVAAISGTRTDIDEMRAWRPGWFPPMHSRVPSNLIHDRIWARLTAALVDDETVAVVEDGPRRDIHVGMHFMLRIKRHRDGNKISTYPTQGALEFYIQPLTLPGLELVTLAAGYQWDPELHEIKAPVISYRDGQGQPDLGGRVGGA